MGHPCPLFCLFSSFQTNITIFTTINVKKCPSSIRCWDLNPQPSEHESPPITTRQVLPPNRNEPLVRYLISLPPRSLSAWYVHFRNQKMKYIQRCGTQCRDSPMRSWSTQIRSKMAIFAEITFILGWSCSSGFEQFWTKTSISWAWISHSLLHEKNSFRTIFESCTYLPTYQPTTYLPT